MGSMLGYNEPIKSEDGNQLSTLTLTEKKTDSKKILDIELKFKYNESIKSKEWFHVLNLKGD